MSLNTKEIEDIQLSLGDYPGLRFYPNATIPYIEGYWPVAFNDVVIETYQIKIVFPKDYPNQIPLVYELSEKIPRKADRHLNSPDWNACLFVADARWEIWPLGTSFLEFLKVPVHNFFLWQAYFDEFHEPPPWGEMSHKEAGVIEYYYKKLQVDDPIKAFRLLLATRYIVAKNDPCPCSSKKPFKDCHLSTMKAFKKKADSHYINKAIDLFYKLAEEIIKKDKEKRTESFSKILETSPENLL